MAIRYDQDKPALDLVPSSFIEETAKVLTFGARKYAKRQWEKGMLWSRSIASLQRHINSFAAGDDFDPESGLMHLSHAACNLAFLIEYTKTHPELDDRPRRQNKKIGLDIDDVLADFVGAYKKRYGFEGDVHFWDFDPNMAENMKVLQEDKEFWLSLKPLVDPTTLSFTPHCYITARSIPLEWTCEWLNAHGFPPRPVHSVGFQQSKVEAVQQSGCQWFVDDRYANFLEINQMDKVCCFLLTTPQNKKHDVGIYRINSLADLPK